MAIIGAGITGLTAAYLLAKEGKDVLVLDDGPLAGGQSERTTAHITSFLDRRYGDLLSMYGPEKATKIAASQMAAVEEIGHIATCERIDCDFSWLDAFLLLGREQETKTLLMNCRRCRMSAFRMLSLEKPHCGAAAKFLI